MPPRVTLTFDNGPTPGVTESVLDELARHRARAVFFVVGQQAADPRGRALVERAASEGHLIGNHTMTHTIELGCSDDPELPEREIAAAQSLLGDLAGSEPLFRPYCGGGILDERVLSAAAVDHLVAGGYSLVLWNSLPEDWRHPDTWVERCLADLARREWSVVVVHDQATGAMRHLGAFLEELATRGFELTTELPDAVVPIRRGRVSGDLAPLVSP